MASAHSSTGYGPRSRIQYDGNSESYKIWETRFINYLYTLDTAVHKAILPLPSGKTDDTDFDTKNRRAYAELVQVLDEKSLQLIMNDAEDHGRNALKILREHYASTEKPRIMTLYENLTTITMTDTEDVTDYLIRAENAATGLRLAGETISDNLVIAMLLKGLPASFNSFVVVHTQSDTKKTLKEFKAALHNHANTEAIRTATHSTALAAKDHKLQHRSHSRPTNTYKNRDSHSTSQRQCLACGHTNHITKNCRVKHKLTCEFCHKGGHVESVCFQKKKLQQSALQTSTNQSTSFSFTVSLTHADTTTTHKLPRQDSTDHKLLVDCGATCHIINNKEHFTSYDSSFDPSKHYIQLADGHSSNTLAIARGVAEYTMLDNNDTPHTVKLTNALLAPDFPASLFSVRAATDAGGTVTFTKTQANLTSNHTTFDFVRDGNLYFLPVNSPPQAKTAQSACLTDSTCSNDCTPETNHTHSHTAELTQSANLTNYTVPYTTDATLAVKTLNEWHIALGHMNCDDILQLQKVTQGMTITKAKQSPTCEVCQESKITRQPKSCDITPQHATKPLERVHTDICGPIEPTSREGFKYVINFIDEHTSMLFVYTLRSKDEATTALKKLIADVAPIGKIKELHSDNGGEYTSNSFQTVLQDNGIKHSTTAPYTPYQNGKSERTWRSLLEMARCLISDASLHKSYWPYAVRYAQYLRNRAYQRRTGSTAYEMFTGIKPNMKDIHKFGTTCTYYIEGNKQKLEARGQHGIFLGINPLSQAYYVLSSKNNNILTTRNIHIHKNTTPDSTLTDPIHTDFEQTDNYVQPTSVQITLPTDTSDEQTTPTPQSSRPTRNTRPPKYLADYHTMSATVDYAYAATQLIPATYTEAINSDNADKWKAAMDTEVTTLNSNNTWELTPLPDGRSETQGRWVYTLKQAKNADEIHYKARYVAKGFTQIHGIDYEETFSPTTRFVSIRTLLQKAVNDNLYLHQMDVKGAYLNAPIDKDIFVQQPPGYEQTDASGKLLTCHLKKSLYGLKQSGRNWHSTLTDFLKKQGFTPNQSDQCVYTYHAENKDQIIILFWVDDIIIGSNNLDLISTTKQLLNKEFNMDDRGEINWFLGIDFTRLENGCYQISQKRYAESILKRFKMDNCKAATTPAVKGLTLEKATDEEHQTFLQQNFPYRQAIGSLIYLMTGTRPDISWIVSKLSQFLDKPGPTHVIAVKRLLRYIQGTKHYTITYSPTNGQLVGYVDSDWAGDIEDRRSTTGFIITLGGAPISWKSKKQQTVALSSCEAEYMALTDATKELLYLRTFCISIEIPQTDTTTLYCDNQGAISLTADKPGQHSRTKHIDVKYHFVRHQPTIVYDYIRTDENKADVLTKPLGAILHRHAISQLQIEGAC